MTFAHVGTLGAAPGRRDDLVALLTRRSDVLAGAGCLLYEVGLGEDADTVCVMELWTTAESHEASLHLPAVQEALAQARPMLSGSSGVLRFEVAGSPLRDVP